VIAITKKRFLIGNGPCLIGRQVRLRNSQGGGVRLHGNRRCAFAHLKGFGRRRNHSVIPSGRSLKPALEGADDIILGSVMPLGAECAHNLAL